MGGITINVIATVAAWALIGLGFFAIFLPIAPSIPIVWLGMFIYAISHNWVNVNKEFMTLISGIAIFTIFLDYTLYKFGIRKFRAGLPGVLGAVIGFFVGSFINPWIAFLIGPVLGAVAFETLRGHDQVYSFQTGNTTIVAFMGGTVVKLVSALAMVGLFVMKLQGKL